MKAQMTMAAVSLFLLATTAGAEESAVSCEDLIQEVTATLRTVALTPADKAKVVALLEKARQECSIEDDDQATADLQTALAMMGQ